MDLNEIAVFIRVIQEGSFKGAGLALGMPNSTVSAKVSALEKRLGITLIQRTTRRLSLTSAGQNFFDSASRGIAHLESAEAELLSVKGGPRGRLRLTAPVELGSTLLPALIAEFTKLYPDVRVDAHLSDDRVDLVGGGFDLAIRAGELRDSTLIAKKLGQVSFALFATARYLKSKRPPRDPADLAENEFLQFSHLGTAWTLTNGKVSRLVNLPGRIVVNDLNMIKAMTVANMGIALLPTFFCGEELSAGHLVRVLPAWRTAWNPVHFVYPAQKFVPPKVTSFIEMASGKIKAKLI